MADPTDLSIAEAREALKRKELSAEELARAHIGAIERANEALNAYILTTPERALELAKESDARLRKGEARPLDGIPLGIKDLFATKGCAPPPARPFSTVSRRLTNRPSPPICGLRGAVMLGKLNKDEFAMGSSNETSHFRPVVNPWRRAGAKASWCQADRRAARQRRSRRASAWARPPPTPAARSASPPPLPAPSASSRPMAAARAGASSPSPRRSIRPDRSRAPCRTRRSCSKRWRATIRRTRPASMRRCRTSRPRSISA